MQGAPKRQVNAEDMLAELKRVVEASTHAPSAPPSSAATAPRPSASGPETWRSQIDNGGDRAAKAKADSSIGQPAHSQKSAGPSSRRWKLTAGGLALAGAAVFAGFAVMNQAPDRPAHEFSPPATEGVAQSQDQPALRPMSDLRSPSRPNFAQLQQTGVAAGRGESRSGRVASCLFRLSAGSARTAAAHAEPGARPGAHGTDRAGRSAARNGAVPSCLVSAASCRGVEAAAASQRLARRSAARHGDVRPASADLAPQRLLPRRRGRRPPPRRRRRKRRDRAQSSRRRGARFRFDGGGAARRRNAQAQPIAEGVRLQRILSGHRRRSSN